MIMRYTFDAGATAEAAAEFVPRLITLAKEIEASVGTAS
jgi:hypothetical protein